jgi:hypothetical protein
MRLRPVTGFVLFLGVLAAGATGQTPPLAPEFQVNTTTASDQYGYGIAMDQAGNFVVVWESYAQDGESYGIEGRRIDSASAPRGPEFQVNQTTAGDQGYPAVASDPAGNYLVVWQSEGQDGSGAGVFGRRYDKRGTALGDEFPINSFTTGDQIAPTAATDQGGNFVVVWESAGQDGDGAGVFGRRFDNAGVPLGADFRINSFTTNDQKTPAVAMAATGEFTVVWQGAGPTAANAVFGRRFNAAGAPQGTEFQVSTSPTPEYPAVAADRTGAFTVVWEGFPVGGTGRDVVARRYDAAGTPLGPEFRVNTFTAGDQLSPSVAMDPSGNFIVGWESPNQDGSAAGIFGQRFGRAGTFIGSEFQINAFTTGAQQLPRVATSALGNVAVMWNSLSQDGSSYGVFARQTALQAAPSIAVDAHAPPAGRPTASNVNNMLEPGEAVLVETAWKNTGTSGVTMTGGAPSVTGPAGATYGIDDATADYGTVGAGATASCFDATGDCYVVSVSNPAVRPTTHWDIQMQENLSAVTPKTWPLHVGNSFTDVPTTQLFYRAIETVLHGGITAGCTATTYCPGDPVTRSQMSLFLGRGVAGSGAAIPGSGTVNSQAYNCVAGGVSLFTDVLPTDIFCRSVHYLAAQNVTTGCSPTQYCPTPNVTRIEMSAFVARAVVAPGGGAAVPISYGPDPVTGFSYSCDAGNPNIHFTDVPASNTFCKHAHFLWAKGIISGCGPTTYCPNDNVTRDAMARFLTNGFNVKVYGP